MMSKKDMLTMNVQDVVPEHSNKDEICIPTVIMPATTMAANFISPDNGNTAHHMIGADGKFKSKATRLKHACFPGMARDVAAECGDKDAVLKATIRELIIYIIFVVILTLLTFGMREKIYFYFTNSLEELIVRNTNFNEVYSSSDYVTFLERDLPQSLYWESWYNGQPLASQGLLYGENKLLGLPMLRQVRVKSNSCTVHADFRSTIDSCFDEYSKADEDHLSFSDRNVTGTAWTFQNAESLNMGNHWGRISTYQGGGYVQLLGRTADEYLNEIKILKDNLWIDRGTRAVFLDFSVYNANLNLFCVVRLVAEFPASGGVVTSSAFHTVRLLRYVRTWDYFIAGCEIIFVLYVVYYTIEEMFEISAMGIRYFKHFWNWLDVINVLIAISAIIFNVIRYLNVQNTLEPLTRDESMFANFEPLAFWETRFNELNAVNVFLCWLKIFKYISFNKTMTQLSRTLSAAASDLLGFSVMFFIFFFAYAQFGYIVFGNVLRDFHTFGDSTFTLFRIILGDFDFIGLEKANRILGPIYFITYILFVFFILLNMFLAIIADTYSAVKERLRGETSDLEVGIYFKQKLNRIKNTLRLKEQELSNLQESLTKADEDNNDALTYQELCKAGGSDFALATLKQYDLDKDGTIDASERSHIMADLEKSKEKAAADAHAQEEEINSIAAACVSGVSEIEFSNVVRRVDRLEEILGSIATQIDRVLTSLDRMELSRVRQQRSKRSKIKEVIRSTPAVLSIPRNTSLPSAVSDE